MGEEIKSNAERKMYDILQELDLKNAYVLHSLGLPKHKSKIYGEIDFVVVCDRGVLCLEIKGGRVECHEGKWLFTDRYGVERQKSEGPFAQVTGNMFSLLTVLKDHFSYDPHMKNVLVGCGVVFPDIEFKSRGQEIIPEIIFDKTTKNITEYINQVYSYWEGRQHREPSKLPPALIKQIVDFLRGDFTFVPSLADRLDDVEKRLIRLTAEQARIMEALSENDHLMINGYAGTGKTVLATNFAMQKAAQGKRVLYLTFNKNLAQNLLAKAGEQEHLKIINIHALFGEYVEVDVEQMKADPRTYFSQTLPDVFYEYISNLSEEELDKIRYDLLVMDEGQDIIRPTFLFALDHLLKNGLEKGHWAVFYDEKQNIYNPEYADGMELLQSYYSTKFSLFVNCRNTVQIGDYSERVSGWKLGEYLRENGEEVQRIHYKDEKDFKEQIDQLLEKLRDEKIKTEDITFIAPKKYANSILGKCGIKVNELGDDFDSASHRPRFSTIQGFKGLDSGIIILCDVESLNDHNYSQFMYIGTTRARTLLFVVASEEFWKTHGEGKGEGS